MEDSNNEDEDLEDRMYALLHYVDGSAAQINANIPPQLNPVITPLANGIRRYWKTSEQNQSVPYQKYNKSNEKSAENINKCSKPVKIEPTNLKHDEIESMFQTPPNADAVSTIEIEEVEIPKNVTVLESSDEDEVVEIALPPQPTITIESSDDDDVIAVLVNQSDISKKDEQKTPNKKKKKKNKDRQAVSSPVPSVMSSMSDDFIKGDCVAFNITSKDKETQNFDFNLHGNDLANNTLNNELSNESRKKKKDKKGNKATSTPKPCVETDIENVAVEDIFATPKNKAKKKKRKSISEKNYTVSKISIPEPDIYETDSSQSIISDTAERTSKEEPTIIEVEHSDNAVDSSNVLGKVTNKEEHAKSPMTSVNIENLSPITKHVTTDTSNVIFEDRIPSEEHMSPNSNVVDLITNDENEHSMIDLTDPGDIIDTNIVMGNVSFDKFKSKRPGLNINEVLDSKNSTPTTVYKPAIFQQDLDFNKFNSRKKIFSPKSLRNDMERFYSESWGGENFNHQEIQRSMSRDRNLWMIDQRDRILTPKRKPRCGICNRMTHRESDCHMRPKKCHMCGEDGHNEPRCPYKLCVNCGTPNYLYTTKCRNCSQWSHIVCRECKLKGHPERACPDLWRRYHYTIDHTDTLVKETNKKYGDNVHCSGCGQRGHFVHTCKNCIPFTTLPIYNPYVFNYTPIYPPPVKKIKDQQPPPLINTNKNTSSKKGQEKKFADDISFESNEYPSIKIVVNNNFNPLPKKPETTVKNMSRKSWTVNESHSDDVQGQNTKRRFSSDQISESHKRTTSLCSDQPQIKKSQQLHPQENQFAVIDSTTSPKTFTVENIGDPNEQPISTAFILLERKVFDKLHSHDGNNWLQQKCNHLSITVDFKDDSVPTLCVKGSIKSQDIFQNDLKRWTDPGKKKKELLPKDFLSKNRIKALERIEEDLAKLRTLRINPTNVYKAYTYNLEKHTKLLKMKNISSVKLANSRRNINQSVKMLNMALIGQAGFDKGYDHLENLLYFLEQLYASKADFLSNEIFENLNKHYLPIFGTIQRSDYKTLLKPYQNKNFVPFSEIMNRQNNFFMRELAKWDNFLLATPMKQKKLKTRDNFLNKIRDLTRNHTHFEPSRVKEYRNLINQVKQFLGVQPQSKKKRNKTVNK